MSSGARVPGRRCVASCQGAVDERVVEQDLWPDGRIVVCRPGDPGRRQVRRRDGGGYQCAGRRESAVVTLIRQAMTATRVIEAAAVDAALAEGTLVPPSLPGATQAQQRAADLLAQIQLPQGDGVYSPDGRLLPEGHQDDDFLTLVTLGDSTSVGYGTTHADDLPGVILARGVADQLNRPVRLRSHGLTGATSADLPRQLDLCLAEAPDAVVILVGANDIRDMVPPWRSAAQLGATVAKLTSRRIPVVVGTCPDFGVITPIPQPLRSMLSQWLSLIHISE